MNDEHVLVVIIITIIYASDLTVELPGGQVGVSDRDASRAKRPGYGPQLRGVGVATSIDTVRSQANGMALVCMQRRRSRMRTLVAQPMRCGAMK